MGDLTREDVTSNTAEACAAGETFDERQNHPMNRLWRRLDVTEGSSRKKVCCSEMRLVGADDRLRPRRN